MGNIPPLSFSELRQLLASARSVRKFDASRSVPADTLLNIVGLCRLTPSGRNIQPFKYRIVDDPDDCNRIFPLLSWAGYLKDWPGPEPHERPAAYLVQCLDTHLAADPLCDDGLQLQALTLGIRACGLGSCIIKAFNAPKLAETLAIPENLMPRYVLAIGFPAEKVVIEDMKGNAYEYWREPDGSHHVPKRQLSELIISPDKHN